MSDVDWRSLAERTANRIKLLQQDPAGNEPQAWNAIASAVSAALDEVEPADRMQFARAVVSQVADRCAESSEVQGDSPDASAAGSVDEVDALVRRLGELAAAMPDAQRARTASRLAEAGLTAGGFSGVSIEASDRLRAVLQMSPEAPIDFERLARAAATVLEKMVSLDDIAWKNWQQISHTSRSRGRSSLARLIGQYVSHADSVELSHVSEELESFRRLAASLMLALSQSGQAAYQQIQRLHPDEIEGIIRNEKGSVFIAKEVRCWRRYRELSSSLDAAMVESEVLRNLATWVNEWMSR